MIALDRDVLVKLRNSNQAVIDHLQQYSTEEWTLPAHVAWESFQYHTSRAERRQEQRRLRSTFDRILSFTDDTAIEASYLDDKLQSQDVVLDAVDLFTLATVYTEGGTFVTHNKRDVDEGPVHSLADVDVVHTAE
ncbi:type II toxin-antitoxin system VapC family toxin [Halorientalis sp.]|uniref:type II toxin-antitoxin system VapC family toxin n=1 Tax=Halorientalis sp. TaxID=1931229 RepID=UPI00260D4707|nr:PIN domain-containing protein [Halorientalis sp.]